MHAWLRGGKRVEYTVALITVVLYLFTGFVLTRNASTQIRWSLWILAFILILPISVGGLIYGRWVRRRDLGLPQPTIEGRRLVPLKTRLKIYLALAVVTAISAIEQARVLPRYFFATADEVFFWNFVVLSALVAIFEAIQWRARRSQSRARL